MASKWNKEKSFLSKKDLEKQGCFFNFQIYPNLAYQLTGDDELEWFHILSQKEYQALKFLILLQKDVTHQFFETPTGTRREALTVLNMSILATINIIKGE